MALSLRAFGWLPGRPTLGGLLVAAAVLWHALWVLGPPHEPPPPGTDGRDFASYYYAADVALHGGDPYHKDELDAAAAGDGARTWVHPYFYPPPFLWSVVWAPLLPLKAAFWVWFGLNELALLATCGILLAWWRRFDDAVAPALALFVAVSYAVAYSAELGQVNFPVLALALAGLATERRWPALGGALVGLACMAKMSPAILVGWWLVRRRWAAVGGAVATAVGTTLLTLPLVGPAHQLEFYTRVLPALGAGDYNGLSVKIEMFGNHSIPNVWHLYFPSGANALSAPARILSAVSATVVVGGALAAFAAPTRDRVQLAAQASALLVLMLLVPVYTFEHHLVFAIPAMVLAVVAVRRGWLSAPWQVVLGVALPVLLFDLSALRDLDLQVVTVAHPVVYIWIEEAKLGALLALAAAMVRLGGTAWDDRSRPPAPEPG